jgi:hypothetical protein
MDLNIFSFFSFSHCLFFKLFLKLIRVVQSGHLGRGEREFKQQRKKEKLKKKTQQWGKQT